MEETTVPKELQKLTDEKPDKTAFIFVDKHWNKTILTRKDVWEKSRKFAAILRRNDIHKGDIVCNNLLNTPERVITDFGILTAGASPLQGQFLLLNGEDLIRTLQVSECKAIILDSKQTRSAFPFIEALKYIDLSSGQVRYRGLPHLRLVLEVNVFVNEDINAKDAVPRQRFLKSLDDEHEMYEDKTINGSDRAYILITSGTTGLAKLVCHVHKSIIAMGKLMSDALKVFTEETIYYNDRSLGWVAGLPLLYVGTGCIRAATDLSCGSPDDIAKHILRMVSDIKCDVGLLLPFEISKVMQHLAAGHKLERKLPMVVTGGGPLPRGILSFLGPLSDTLGIIYGSSECGFIACHVIKDKSEFQDNCVGHPATGVTFKVVDDNRDLVPVSEIGEVLIGSPTLALEYLNNPEQTKGEISEGGWFRPGDIVRLDEEGRLFVYCRKSNAILKAGVVIYPGWIEAHMNKCPGVMKSVAIDIPDPVIHKDIVLCVMPAKDASLKEENLLAFCKRTFVSNNNPNASPCIPKHVLFFDAIPLNANGKVDRKSLRAEVYKRLEIAV